MIVRYSIGLCILVHLVWCERLQSLGDGLSYPQSEEQDPSKHNAMQKTPVSLPNSNTKCKPGEYLYPGDQGDDWVCDCKPGYLYYPLKQECYPAYLRGPCREGEHLVLPKTGFIPECVFNPCRENEVKFLDGNCYELDKNGPCPLANEINNVIGVNETTMDIICTKGKYTREQEHLITTRFDPNVPISNNTFCCPECFQGGIRWTAERCPQQVTDKNILSVFSSPTQRP